MGLKFASTAAQYAYEAHLLQRRKYSREYYFLHCERVAKDVRNSLARQSLFEGTWNECPPDVYEGVPVNIIVDAAYLHDVIEDTDKSYSDIFDVFGKTTADLVWECTNRYTPEDYPNWNRVLRKNMEAKRLGTISKPAQLIKRCDMADNIGDFIINDPAYALKYMSEKINVLQEMLEE